jgi:hypothetical protein
VALLRLTPSLWRVRHRTDLRRVMRTHIRGVPLCLYSEPRRWLRLVQSAPGAGRPPGQHPHSLCVPDLPAHPFPQPDETARALEKSFAGIAAEFRGVVDDDEDVIGTPKAKLSRDASTHFPLRRERRGIERNIARCPGGRRTYRPATGVERVVAIGRGAASRASAFSTACTEFPSLGGMPSSARPVGRRALAG